MIQSSDNFFYDDFCLQYEGITVKEDKVFSIHGLRVTEKDLARRYVSVKLSGMQRTAAQILIEGEYVSRKVNSFDVKWLDVIPPPLRFKVRVLDPVGDYMIFSVKPTPDELEGIAKGELSERIKQVLGGTLLPPATLKRRLKKANMDGVLYRGNW